MEQKGGLLGTVFNRRTTNGLRKMLDTWLPPVIRESPPFGWLVKVWLGRNAIPDLKYRAFRMSDEEFSAAYAGVSGAYGDRESDTTPAQAGWILQTLGKKRLRVLEIGPGNGALTRRLRDAGHDVWVLDLHAKPGEDQYIQGTIEELPVEDKSFDALVVAHVIEHVRSLTRSFIDMERVCRGRVLIVTPKQRFLKWTFDYHLHFFYTVDHLASHIPAGRAEGCELDGDLCLLWDVSWRPSVAGGSGG